MSPWEKLLEQPHSRGHFVQLYQADDGALASNVSRYLWEGLRRGEGALLIARPEHELEFSRHLDRMGADLATLIRNHQLVYCDAAQTLRRLMAGGQPDWRLFESAICAAVRQVRPAPGCEGLRAYGEMVGLLWDSRQFAAAIRLEQLWNRLLEQSSFSLYCAYEIDIFGKESELANLDGVLCTHSHLVPAQAGGPLEMALNRSLDEVLGSRADALRARMHESLRPSWAVMPSAENTVLWLRRNLPEIAGLIVERARRYYLARVGEKEKVPVTFQYFSTGGIE